MSQLIDGDNNENNAGVSKRIEISETDAPEKALTHFAMRLALLEKTATGIGTLGFIWATVVLLGGFAITLDTSDFWFITIILVIEGARIFSRSHELEAQHQATWSNADVMATLSANSNQSDAPSSSTTGDNADAITPPSGNLIQPVPLPPSSSTAKNNADTMDPSSANLIQSDSPSSSTTRNNIDAIAPSSGNLIQHVQPSSSTAKNNADAMAPSSGNLIQPDASSSSCTRDDPEAITPPSGEITQDAGAAISTSSTRDEENQLPPVQPRESAFSVTKIIFKVRDWLQLQASTIFHTKNLCKVWYFLQLLSAVTCVVLSLIKLIMHNFGHVEKYDTDKRNRKAALLIFYSLVLAEASLFIMEKAYWEWKTRICKLLENVNKDYGLETKRMVSTRRFFYDAYSKSINGSVFDSLRMDMVSFAVELLISNSPNEQLIGARLLRELSTNKKYSSATLRKIGVDKSVIERLVEMLNWRNPNEEEIRKSAAAILEQVASKKQNSPRIAEIPGAVESIASLLHSARRCNTSDAGEFCQIGDISDDELKKYVEYNNSGLKILKKLSHDHENCGKIGNTRDLLPKIIDFTHTTEDMFRDKEHEHPHIATATLSLKLVIKLLSSPGITGSNLRKEISEIVFTISFIRNILKNGGPKIQLSGIQVLTKLGLEDDATEKIGGTGGVLEVLLNIFFMEIGSDKTKEKLRTAAGDAISMLTLESKNNCNRILKLRVLDNLVNALKNKALCINTARILRNLLIYTDKEDPSYNTLLRIEATAPTVSNK